MVLDFTLLRLCLTVERALNVRSLSDRDEPEYDEARRLPASVDDEPIQRVLDKERGEQICAAMACLNERDRRFLRLRYGMDGDPRTLEEIGQQEGITRERVRQIQLCAELKLRTYIERELKDLLPSRVVDLPQPKPETGEVLPDVGKDAEAAQVDRTSYGTLASSCGAVLTQKEAKLAGLHLERDPETTEHRVFQTIT